MSDYLYSSCSKNAGSFRAAIQSIYEEAPPEVYEYQGDWGALAVTRSHYQGFQPYETDEHLVVIIGGPVLYFRDNEFLIEEDSNIATKAIYDRWIVEGNMQWDEDLSGPFTVLLINKNLKNIVCVTDLMAFIPVYTCHNRDVVYMGTHIDTVARIAGKIDKYDQTSLADFILNNAITYPYTAYQDIFQVAPSSENYFDCRNNNFSKQRYWAPLEINPYDGIGAASKALREGLEGYISRITNKMSKVGQFISGGEDSRALAGLLPKRLKRDAFVFLNSMNREGAIAKKVSETYGAKFNVGYRSETHYLKILPAASKLVGNGHQYFHAHSLGFDKYFNLASYSAVFGGYLSDALLKAPFCLKRSSFERYPFIPEFLLSGENRSVPIESPIISTEILDKINVRRWKRLREVQSERPATAHEWFVLYPATMRVAITNFYSTRRLFRSYEPFMCKEVVKVSAAVPTNWKLNRKLFNKAMKPYLRNTRWLLHGDGRLPYFSYKLNMPLQFLIWTYRQIAKRFGFNEAGQGAWPKFTPLTATLHWKNLAEEARDSTNKFEFMNKKFEVYDVLMSDGISVKIKLNLLQLALAEKTNSLDQKKQKLKKIGQ